jgi:hypothetical protein
MLTDRPPLRPVLLAEFIKSEQLATLELPTDDRLCVPARAMEAAMKSGENSVVRRACAEFLAAAANFYSVPIPPVRILAARPLRVREGGWDTELFGDYHPDKDLIRVWMRTAVRKQLTSFGTFLSTLCHEFCHHLDYAQFGFSDSLHTRDFYERAAVLYHHTRGTPKKPLVWVSMRGGCWRIDWQRTNRGA